MAIESHIEQLKRRHADLDTKLATLNRSPSASDSEIAGLKRDKLRLKDEIERLSS